MEAPAPRLLIVEDSPDDALLLIRELHKGGCNPVHRRVDTATDLIAALDQESWDLLITDYCLPGMTGEEVLRIAKDRKPQLPCIVVSGTIGEEVAVRTMQAGASDYILKHNLARLCPAVEREIREARDRASAREHVSAVEARLESLLTRLDVGVFRTTVSGQLLEANRALLDLLGFQSFADAAATDCAHMYAAPDDRNTVLAALRRTGALRKHETQMRCVDGRLIWVALTETLSRAPDGEEVIDGLMEDITARKEAEQTRHEAEARFRRLVECAPDLIHMTATDGTILSLNPAFEAMTGWRPEEWIGRKFYEFIHPDDLTEVSARVQEMLGGGRAFPVQGRMRAKSGDYITVENIGVPLMENGHTVGHMGIVRDITRRTRAEQALRDSEERFRQLAHNIQEVFWLVEAETNKLLYVSPAYETVWGRPVQSLYDDTMSFLESIHADDRPRVAAAMVRQAEGGFDEEYRIVRPDGTERWIRDRAFPIRDAQGRVFRIAGIAEDITERRLGEQRLRRQLDRLAALRAIDLAITGSLDLRVTLNVFLDQVTSQLQVDAANVLLLDPHTKTLEFAAGRGFHTGKLHESHIRLGEGYSGQAALDQRFVRIPDLAQVNDFERASLIAGEGFVTYLCMPLVSKGQVKGVLEIFHRTLLEPEFDWMEFLGALATQASIAIDNATLFTALQRSNIELQVAYDATLEGWVRALDLRDDETEGHTQRVTEMTLRLARCMGFSEADLVHIRRGALLHDIGKVGISDRLLLKPGKLEDDEWVTMRRHPVYAHDLLAPITYLRPALDIPFCHHEKWDGTGYPRGLKGDAIPLAARVFAIVDVWDALLSDRPYRQAWPIEKVKEYIQSQAGTHFDPQVVETFFAIEPWHGSAPDYDYGHSVPANGGNGHATPKPPRKANPRTRRSAR